MNIPIPTGWELSSLGEVCDLRRKIDVYSELYIGLEHIGQGNNALISKGNVKDFKSVKNSFKKGDILYGKLRPLLNKVYLATEDGYCSTDILPLYVNAKIIAGFLLRVLSDKRFLSFAISTSSGTKMPRTNWSDIKDFKLLLPPLHEQRKIAVILSTVDELIEKTDQIIEQTQRLKKGLMQKLLTKGIGHNKFKKVNWYFGKFKKIPDSWNYVLLDNVARRGTGHTPDAKKPEYYNGGVKWVSLADSNRLDKLYISETTKEISELGIENSSAVRHPAGTVIMSRDAGVGKSAILKSEMAVSQHFVTWKGEQNLDNHFLYYLLQSWKPLFESVALGTTIKTIGLPFFKKLLIPLPPLSEQLRIAAILMKINFSIMKEIEYHSELKLLKKGLMQNLITGKIRVKV